MNKAMKSYPACERPYERFEMYGPGALSDGELLAVILRSGSRRQNVKETAGEVLEMAGGSLQGLCNLTVSELCRIEGIGRIKAIQLLCTVQIAKRIWREGVIKDDPVFSVGEAAAYYMQELRHLEEEHVYILMLDAKRRRIGEFHAGIGGVDFAPAPAREIVKESLKRNAVSIIMIHNHPSGDPHPSRDDWEMARDLAAACAVSGISLADSIIIGDGRYFSLKESCAPDTELSKKLFSLARKGGENDQQIR